MLQSCLTHHTIEKDMLTIMFKNEDNIHKSDNFRGNL